MIRNEIVKPREKVIGILGGMGPESTADFFLRVIKATPARSDQGHLRIIIDNNPKIPDRTLALLGEGESPLEPLKEMIRNLEKAGAEIIAMPCNTAHYYYEELQESTNVPIINMILETAAYVHNAFPNIRKIGLLATSGAAMARIYHRALEGIELVVPDEKNQRKVMNTIYGAGGIKAGFTQGSPRTDILEVAKVLIEAGVEAIIIGCTEISLVLSREDLLVPLIDPLQILAGVTVKKARQS